MTTRSTLFLVVSTLLALTFLSLSACDGAGTDPDPPKPPPEPEMVTVTVDPTDKNGQTVTDARLYIGDEQIGRGETAIERPDGTEESIRIEADGFETETVTVTFNRNRTETLVLTPVETHPETVVLTVTPVEADSTIETAELTYNGEPIGDGTGTQTITVDYATSAQTLCGVAEYFNPDESCAQVVPDRDRAVTLEMVRKTVTLDVSAGYPVDEPTPIEATLFVNDVEVGTDHVELMRPMHGGSYYVEAIYGAATANATVSASESHELMLQLPDLVNCNDGLSNDGDPLTDAEDRGCVGPDNDTWDPEDDVEELKEVTRTGYTLASDTNSVSGGEEIYLVSISPPQSIMAAVEVHFATDNAIEAGETGEEFSLRFECGENFNNNFANLNNVNETGVVQDEAGVTGWRFSAVPDITPEFFATGTSCLIYAIGKGSGETVFTVPDRTFSTGISWRYEEEDVQSQ